MRVLSTRERRFLSPHPAFARAKLEPIHQPLYSTHFLLGGLSSAQDISRLLFFQSAIGGPFPGATNLALTPLQTNMTQAGFLPTPKLFLVEGMRVLVKPTNDQGDPSPDTSAATAAAQTFGGVGFTVRDEALTSMLQVLYGSVLELTVGTKLYVQAPSFLFPANTGADGFSRSILGVGASSTNVSVRQYLNVKQGVGRDFLLPRYPVLIPSLQSFSAALRFPQSAALRPLFVNGRNVICILDGILGREVQ